MKKEIVGIRRIIGAKLTSKQLLDLIGQPPEGSHQDEWLPRASSWHEERLNWIKEVNQLRSELKRLKPQFVKG